MKIIATIEHTKSGTIEQTEVDAANYQADMEQHRGIRSRSGKGYCEKLQLHQASGKPGFSRCFYYECLAWISTGVVRVNALKLVASEEEYSNANVAEVFREPMELFKLNDRFIDDEGRLIRQLVTCLPETIPEVVRRLGEIPGLTMLTDDTALL